MLFMGRLTGWASNFRDNDHQSKPSNRIHTRQTQHRKVQPWRPAGQRTQVWPYLVRIEFLAA